MSSTGSMAAIEQALERLRRGQATETDLQTLRSALKTKQIALISGDRAAHFGDSVTDTVVVTGDHNYVVTVFKASEADTLYWLLGDIKRSRLRRWLTCGTALILVISVFGIFVSQIPRLLTEYLLPALAPPPQVEIVLDVSQRMRTEMDEPGQTKFDVARDAILQVLDTWEGSEVEASLRLLGGSGGTEACEVVPNLSLLEDFTQDYDKIRQDLQNLAPYGPEAPDAPLADTLRSSVRHLADGGSPSQTIMVFTGGDDTCGQLVQLIFDALANRPAIGKPINSKTYLIVLGSEKIDNIVGAPGHEVSLALAQTAQQVRQEAQAVSQSLPPTPVPPRLVRAVDVIAKLAPDTPTAAPTSTTVAPPRPATAQAVAHTVQITPAAPTLSPTPTPPFISQAEPTSTSVPQPTVPSGPTPQPTAPATPKSPTPRASNTPPATVASATNTPVPTTTPTPTWTPTAAPSNTPVPTSTPTVTPTPVPPTQTFTPTPAPTHTPVPTQFQITLEAEDGTGSGSLKQRSAASQQKTVWLHSDETRTLPFQLGVTASCMLSVRYSNDNLDQGPFETLTIKVDGDTFGEFSVLDTGSGGNGWNVFVVRDGLGPAQRPPGDHNLEVLINGGDGYGVEIDKVTLDCTG